MKALKSFRVRIILLLSLIFLLMFAVFVAYFQHEHFGMLWVILGSIIILLLIISLFRQIYEVNNQIADFLMSIRYDDFARTYSATDGNEPQAVLFSEFNAITDKFRNLRSQNEANRQLMQLVFENVDTGIFCADKDGTVLLTNRALKAIFHKSYFQDLGTFKLIDETLFGVLNKLPINERIVQKVVINDEVVQLAIRCFILKHKNDEFRLYTFFNLSGELSGEEIKSYHKLISILSHEIMNSVTPIASLSESAAGMLNDNSIINPENMADVAQALEVIQKRSAGLLKFTENYRRLTKIPVVNMQPIVLEPFFIQLLALMKNEVPKQVELDFKCFRPNMQVSGDPVLLEQVIINLIKNALDAVRETPDGKVLIVADRDEQMRTLIKISDNGHGIQVDNLEQIFIPFFTTKAHGSGIGLSLARQIMRLHQGDIQVVSEESNGTIFTLIFFG
ncbi:MAG: HAMP domain-containing histidine kinase [Saprospiraceae bacterium]|nr:HAMP domain-containing histidine kinase [Saprospiraceae bacterium]MCF8248560.1 HAMP domain-containing histidine kinase [Saprospiraceae bacterium]MCF8280273.1 HAMP domain-containing histidine kinase [Bacteroidales bacterium]MCF8310293.1 HAMP domain-containing histidine kinase [Saprospiraceae bacterium]MCF8439267.1 HAMP domain-containing histidine kinase [Saprospiraceae bacterium]